MSEELELVKQRGPAWAAAMEDYLAAIGERSVYSATRFVIPGVLKVTEDVDGFRTLMLAIAGVMAAKDDHRFEQQAVPVSGTALAARPVAMTAIVAGARRIADAGIEPGWFVQLLVRPLAVADDATFVAAWEQLVDLAVAMARDGQHPGYPIAAGLAALVERNDFAALPRWLEVLHPLARAAKDGVYGLFEHGVGGVARGQLDANDVTDALKLALAMYDHGLPPVPTLGALATPVQLDLATKLAKAGVPPALVITNALGVVESLGWDPEPLGELAIEMHRRGLRQLLFDDGMYILNHLEGLAPRAFQIMQHMVERDLEPAVLFRWTLPRTLGFLRPAWAAAEVLELADALVAIGVAPEPAVQSAARPLVELATDVDEFRRLARAVVELVGRLQALGVDHRAVLFSDVAHLAAAGKESQTFGELLDAFAELLAAWSAYDPSALLERGVPVAAREAAGKPWVLAIALRNATRLAREGHPDHAVTLLEVGVKTASAIDGDFAAALASIEARYTALPPELTEPASVAAGTLAGTDLAKLDRALATIGELHAKHGLVAIARALPDLARAMDDEAGLTAAVEIAIVRPELAAKLAAIVARTARSPAEALAALRAVQTWAAESAERARTLERFHSYAVAARSLVEVLAAHERAFADLPHARVLYELLEHARDEATVRDMLDKLPPLLRDARPALLDGLLHAKEALARSQLAWPYLIAPALATAKQHAGGPILAATSLQRFLASAADAEVVRDLITQRGVRAIDLIASLVAPALQRGVIPSLAAHRELLDRYLREVGFADAEVYAHFVAIATDGDAATQAARIAELRAQIADLTAAIRAGDITPAQRAHALFGVALQHVFPSAVSATRRMWERLVDTMPDRPGDVTALWPDGHAAPLEVAAGSYQLRGGTHDLSAFGWLARVRPAGDAEPRPPAELGWELLTVWSEGRLAREPQQTELARALLAHEDTLPSSATDSASQLLAIRALASDRLSALVELAIVAARGEDAARADRLIQTRLAPAPRIGPGLVKAVARTLERGDADVLRRQLALFDLPADPIAELRAASDLATALHALPARPVEIEPGKELGRIHAELVGQDLAAMTAAIASALEYRASSAIVALDCVVTKRAVHAPIGLTAGVCVATDEELWRQPGFMHLALFDGGVCMGSVHLLVLDEGGERYLALPGINPSFALLDRVEADVLLAALLARAKQLARAANLAGVWIPTAPGIHSNRRAIHEAIMALALPERRTRSHPFSYNPYAYRIEGVYELGSIART